MCYDYDMTEDAITPYNVRKTRRATVTRESVVKAKDAIESIGQQVSLRTVRDWLGGGSFSTISTFLKEIAASEALLGQYKELSCEIVVTEGGQSIRQRTGKGILRVDPAVAPTASNQAPQ